MWTAEMVLVSLNTLALAGLGTAYWLFAKKYAGAYMQKKGENLATHEDINKLVDQVKAVTETTKKIEAEISEGVWNRQKRWEMKREVLFEAVKRMSELDDALLGFSVVMREDQKNAVAWKTQAPSDEEKLAWFQTRSERVMRWSKASSEFDESKLFVTVVCGRDSIKAFLELGVFVSRLASDITKDAASYEREKAELHKKLLEAKMAIRKELEVDL
jgi:hypothetical protein